MVKKKLMKDFFNEDLAEHYVVNIKEVYPDFDGKNFVEEFTEDIDSKRMSERIEKLSTLLRKYLPQDYIRASQIIIDVLGEENDIFYFPFEKMYYYRALAKFVEMYGLEDFDQSIKVIEEITKRDTAEFAIRPFIKEDYDRVEVVFEKWKNSDNAHLRRLVTEGPRPRLPWAKHISYLREDINENFNLLKPFLNDPSRYVEKSVANHLNDLSRYEADQVVVFLESHFEASSPFVIKRALRTLKKQEHQGALDLLSQLK